LSAAIASVPCAAKDMLDVVTAVVVVLDAAFATLSLLRVGGELVYCYRCAGVEAQRDLGKGGEDEKQLESQGDPRT
jgi:hypothetical protein